MKKFAAAMMILLASSIMTNAAEIGFTGDATVVSTYVWRGVTQFRGAALQSTAEFSYGILAGGMWSSTFEGAYAVETDPYIGLSLPTGPVETSIGGTLYGYDFFTGPGSVYEVYASAGYGPAGLTFYFTPEQQDGDVQSVYWLEASAGAAFMGADLSATIGYGTHSDYTHAGDDREAIATLLLSASKAVTEALSVSWNYAYPLSDDDDLSNVFFISAGYGF